MRNIAKCKKCLSVIESFHSKDYVECKCGEIAVDGGEALRCAARDFANFLRVDDEGNEIVVKVKDAHEPMEKPSLNEMISMLDDMIKGIENLPREGLFSPVTQADLASALLLVSSILRGVCKEAN